MYRLLPSLNDPELILHLEKLEQLFVKMDAAYDTAAKQHGFVCNGCEENCCKTLFYHHTFLEFFYLVQGLRKLDAETRKTLYKRAQKVCFSPITTASADTVFRKMCPLNQNGRCQLYAHRPMICRLHGIPYLLGFGQAQKEGEGCDDFYQQAVKTDSCFRSHRIVSGVGPVRKKITGLDKRFVQNPPDHCRDDCGHSGKRER